MDSEQQQHLIEQLIPLLREKDFDDIFNRLTQDENSNSRFLIKMEIKRRCTPCRRVIDMRDELGDECLVHESDGITHFMPAEAIGLFQSQCYLYKDDYTLGVYEALQYWQKHHHGKSDGPLQPPASPFRQYDVNPIAFASYYGRRQERMHFSSPVLIKFADGDKLFAKSSDLSLGGIRVSVPYLPNYQTGAQVEVFFTGLERDHANPVLHHSVSYQILGEESKEGKFWLRLVKTGEHPGFDQFLSEFIESNKSRYRVSVDYLLSAAIIKGYEQFYLPRMTGMPLFFGTGDSPNLEIALRTENNQHLLEYWRDEKNRDALAGLFNAERMKRLCPAPGTTTEAIIYCFTHTVRSHIYFFSATAEELPEATAVMDPFHVVALAGDKLDLCRQRLQQETLGRRGRSGDPLFGIRRVVRTRAALLTRGLAEIARLSAALGGRRDTLMGLAGMGDLILTCTGDLSRNRRVGLALAQNKSLPQILEELGHVAEGVYTAREVDQLSRKLAVDMPISTAVAAVLDGRLTAAQALEQLMSRDPREEIA